MVNLSANMLNKQTVGGEGFVEDTTEGGGGYVTLEDDVHNKSLSVELISDVPETKYDAQLFEDIKQTAPSMVGDVDNGTLIEDDIVKKCQIY